MCRPGNYTAHCDSEDCVTLTCSRCMFAHPSGKQEREEGLVLIREMKFSFQRAADFNCVLRTMDAGR